MKSMIKAMMAVAAFALAIGNVQAKIGDTFETLANVYGKPSWTQQLANHSGSANFWIDHGWIIDAIVDNNGLCQAMLYLKANGKALTKGEAVKLDEANIPVYVERLWKTIPQFSTPGFSNGIGYLSTGQTFFEIVEGSYLLNQRWLAGREYTTESGLRMIVDAPQSDQLPSDVQPLKGAAI
jgi:hypothetical protein